LGAFDPPNRLRYINQFHPGYTLDIFFYWKEIASDIKEGRFGVLGTDTRKLEEVKERLPRKVWTFVTPKGTKGKLQLISSMLIVDEKPASFVPKWKYNLFYDAASPQSIFFTDAGATERVDAVSDYFNNRFNTAFRTNFRQEHGVMAMEADVVRGFEKLTEGFETIPYLAGISLPKVRAR
jgi:hypothetical protein